MSGALGVEAVTARYVENNGFADLTYAALSTGEEFLEMVGASLFLYTLIAYLGRSERVVTLEFSRGSPPKISTSR